MSGSTHEAFTQPEFIGSGNNNRITEIIVYTNQACVKRQVRLNAHPGLNRFLIETRVVYQF